MKKGICIKCQSRKVSRLETWDRAEHGGRDLMVIHQSKPENWLFKGNTYLQLEAYGCFDCGYVEFYMKPGEPDKLS